MKTKKLLELSKPIFQSLMLTQMGITFEQSQAEFEDNLAPNLNLMTQEHYIISRRVNSKFRLNRRDRKAVYALLMKAMNEAAWNIEAVS